MNYLNLTFLRKMALLGLVIPVGAMASVIWTTSEPHYSSDGKFVNYYEGGYDTRTQQWVPQNELPAKLAKYSERYTDWKPVPTADHVEKANSAWACSYALVKYVLQSAEPAKADRNPFNLLRFGMSASQDEIATHPSPWKVSGLAFEIAKSSENSWWHPQEWYQTSIAIWTLETESTTQCGLSQSSAGKVLTFTQIPSPNKWQLDQAERKRKAYEQVHSKIVYSGGSAYLEPMTPEEEKEAMSPGAYSMLEFASKFFHMYR